MDSKYAMGMQWEGTWLAIGYTNTHTVSLLKFLDIISPNGYWQIDLHYLRVVRLSCKIEYTFLLFI